VQSLRSMSPKEIQSMSRPYYSCDLPSNLCSATVPVHAVGVKQTMPFVYLAKGRSHKTKYIPKGKLFSNLALELVVDKCTATWRCSSNNKRNSYRACENCTVGCKLVNHGPEHLCAMHLADTLLLTISSNASISFIPQATVAAITKALRRTAAACNRSSSSAVPRTLTEEAP